MLAAPAERLELIPPLAAGPLRGACHISDHDMTNSLPVFP